ncbi:hypothetical protein [Ethanoligenens sp.]|uniref:hypothetical protein n=1 Tax=Ethanoligenens sp. TaxID=2099655 RepID=UPI0039EB187A
MKIKKLIIITTGCVLVICAAVILFFHYTVGNNKSQNASKVIPDLTVSNEEYSPLVSINSSDTDDIRQKKQHYNELISQADKLDHDFESNVQNSTATDKDYKEYKKKSNEIASEIQGLGIEAESQDTAAQKYEKEVDLYISDQQMVADGCLDQNRKVIPELKNRFDNANKRIAYLKKVKAQYQKGEISAEEALKSFTEQNSIK